MHNLLSMIAEGTKREIESVCERDTGREREKKDGKRVKEREGVCVCV